MTNAQMPEGVPAPLSPAEIEERLRECPRLPSLGTFSSALRDLVNADQRYTAQVAEIIRRDPSLTSRLLRLVNSVYYGLSTPINSIEEGVFYLGVRQIRQLALVTPVIEDFQRLAGEAPFPWREFWRHCIGTAILTREVISSVQPIPDEVDYVAGLVHDVGKIAMAAAFPAHFAEVHRRCLDPGVTLVECERAVLGMDHAAVGACYLRHHHISSVLVETAGFHHAPGRATARVEIVAAVQIADLLARHAGIGFSGDREAVSEAGWVEAEGWGILLPGSGGAEKAIAVASLRRSLERIPLVMEGLL